jgi:hypothetical protein
MTGKVPTNYQFYAGPSHKLIFFTWSFSKFADIRKIFPFELFHLGGDEVNTG